MLRSFASETSLVGSISLSRCGGGSANSPRRELYRQWPVERRIPMAVSIPASALRYLLVGIDAPDIAAPHPAGNRVGLDLAHRAAAFDQPRHDAGLGARNLRRGQIWLLMDRPRAALCHDHVAAAGDHLFPHPAEGVGPIAN